MSSISSIQNVIPEKHIIIFSPHYDDVLFMLGGYIEAAKLSSTFHEKTWEVVTVFSRSNYQQGGGVENYDVSLKRIQFATGVRQLEDLQCLSALLGRHNFTYTLLDEDEALVRGFKLANDEMEFPHGMYDAFREQEWGVFHRLISNIALKAKQADTALVFPIAFREHIDHFILREAACAVLKENTPLATFYFQEDKPYAGLANDTEKARIDSFIDEHNLRAKYYVFDPSKMIDSMYLHYPSQVEKIYEEGILKRASELKFLLNSSFELDCIWAI